MQLAHTTGKEGILGHELKRIQFLGMDLLENCSAKHRNSVDKKYFQKISAFVGVVSWKRPLLLELPQFEITFGVNHET